MHVQIGDDVPACDQIGQMKSPRRFNLAAVLAQFGRHVLHPQRFIDFFFAIAKDFLGGFNNCLSLINRAERVLVQAQTLVQRDLPHLDVMPQAAGEIIQRRTPARALKHTYIHL